jgi:L-threonylcarbamoyladenylate synthase
VPSPHRASGAVWGEAVRAIRSGGVICYPTDTLWGLGADPSRPEALRRLFQVKERPEGMPLSVAFSSLEEIEPWALLSSRDRALLRMHLPGPYTFLVRASPRARRGWAPAVLGPGGRLGVRVPDHPGARSLLAAVGPLTSTSANRHDRPPVRDVGEARRTFGSGVDAYVEAAPAPRGSPSTLVDLFGPVPVVVHRA